MTKHINDDELVDVAGGTDVSTNLENSGGEEGADGHQKRGGSTGGGAGGDIEYEQPPAGGSTDL